MGDPKKQRKKYRKPLMIWDEGLIENQKEILKDFGLKNKREIWKVESKLKSVHDQAKKLIADTSEQSKKESIQLIKKLSNLNLISPDSTLDDVLSLTINDFLKRRLQTLVFERGISRTVKQSRQFITHNHICINEQIMNIPSYLVKSLEEAHIKFNPSSNLAQESHPERPKEDLSNELKKAGIKKEEKKSKEAIPKDKKNKDKDLTSKIKKQEAISEPNKIPEKEISKIDEIVPEEKTLPKEK